MPTKAKEAASGRRALGRGLEALLPDRAPAAVTAQAEAVGKAVGTNDAIRRIPIALIDPNPVQPRRIFRPESIDELAQSIRQDGLIQPIVVQANGSRFTLIVGERRLRAAKVAGIEEIPAIVRQFPPDRILEVTLVENIQREDLNPIEVAEALDRMIRELNLSHEELAARTGKDRTTIKNLLRLLKLPADIQQLVAERRISMGHARAILGLEDAEEQRSLAEKTAAQGLSVRQVERMVRRTNEPSEPAEEPPVDANVRAAIDQLEQRLGTRVRLIEKRGGKGKIEIEFYSPDDLDRIYSVILGE
jgi:ParB family chromosome partitioning protein